MLFDIDDACFNNLVSYWKAIATSPADDTPDHIRLTTGIGSPLYNPVFLKKSAEKCPIEQSGAIHSFWCDAKRNKKIVLHDLPMLEIIMEKIPVMSIRLDKIFSQNSPPEVSISIVENGGDLTKWITPVQICFGLNEGEAERYRSCLENAADHFLQFIVKKDNQIVAAASLFLDGKVAGLYNLAVLPEYRKQGIGTALHFARLNEAKNRGYSHATLQATPMAAKLDSALGFETHSELSIFQFKKSP